MVSTSLWSALFYGQHYKILMVYEKFLREISNNFARTQRRRKRKRPTKPEQIFWDTAQSPSLCQDLWIINFVSMHIYCSVSFWLESVTPKRNRNLKETEECFNKIMCNFHPVILWSCEYEFCLPGILIKVILIKVTRMWVAACRLRPHDWKPMISTLDMIGSNSRPFLFSCLFV